MPTEMSCPIFSSTDIFLSSASAHLSASSEGRREYGSALGCGTRVLRVTLGGLLSLTRPPCHLITTKSGEGPRATICPNEGPHRSRSASAARVISLVRIISLLSLRANH
jgi:hypothetical protein